LEAIASALGDLKEASFGHAMAHEINHLLLRSNVHTQIGIMKAQRNDRDLQNASKGQLLFAPKQAKRIRVDVLERIKKPQSPRISVSETK
jgi:hypothetical protein